MTEICIVNLPILMERYSTPRLPVPLLSRSQRNLRAPRSFFLVYMLTPVSIRSYTSKLGSRATNQALLRDERIRD
jgi:hypothetical protein